MSKKAKSTYYKGALRFSRDGIPCKVAPWVADLSERSRAELMRGEDGQGFSEKSRLASTSERHTQTTYIAPYAIAAE